MAHLVGMAESYDAKILERPGFESETLTARWGRNLGNKATLAKLKRGFEGARIRRRPRRAELALSAEEPAVDAR
jgi:hypothetical protein